MSNNLSAFLNASARNVNISVNGNVDVVAKALRKQLENNTDVEVMAIDNNSYGVKCSMVVIHATRTNARSKVPYVMVLLPSTMAPIEPIEVKDPQENVTLRIPVVGVDLLNAEPQVHAERALKLRGMEGELVGKMTLDPLIKFNDEGRGLEFFATAVVGFVHMSLNPQRVPTEAISDTHKVVVDVTYNPKKLLKEGTDVPVHRNIELRVRIAPKSERKNGMISYEQEGSVLGTLSLFVDLRYSQVEQAAVLVNGTYQQSKRCYTPVIAVTDVSFAHPHTPSYELLTLMLAGLSRFVTQPSSWTPVFDLSYSATQDPVTMRIASLNGVAIDALGAEIATADDSAIYSTLNAAVYNRPVVEWQMPEGGLLSPITDSIRDAALSSDENKRKALVALLNRATNGAFAQVYKDGAALVEATAQRVPNGWYTSDGSTKRNVQEINQVAAWNIIGRTDAKRATAFAATYVPTTDEEQRKLSLARRIALTESIVGGEVNWTDYTTPVILRPELLLGLQNAFAIGKTTSGDGKKVNNVGIDIVLNSSVQTANGTTREVAQLVGGWAFGPAPVANPYAATMPMYGTY